MQLEYTLTTVTNNENPAQGGAIQVAMPEIDGDEYPEWIEPILPPMMFSTPEVGETVAVIRPMGEDISEFSEEVRYIGRLVSETEAFPDEFKENYPKRRGFKTKQGHTIILDDESGDFKIKTYKGDHEINLNGDGTVTIKATNSCHIQSPIIDLNENPTEYLLLETTFVSDFVTTFLTQWSSALSGAATFTTYKTALGPLITALASSAAGWLSTKTRTE